ALIVTGPGPDAKPRCAVFDGRIHVQPLWRRLFARHDNVDVVTAAQTMVSDGQERIGIRRQIDANDLSFLVHDVVDESGVLMAEPVVVLTPDMRGQQIIQRGDGPPPGYVARNLEP